MLIQLLKLINTQVGRLIVAATLIFGLGYWVGHLPPPPPKIVERVVKETVQVKVEVPVITEKVVKQLISNPRQQELINKLILENGQLKVKTNEVLSVLAKLQSTGGGAVTPSVPSNPVVPGNPPGETPSTEEWAGTFKDFQLDAKFTKETFSYTLSQEFGIGVVTGFDQNGDKISLVRMVQRIGETGVREIPVNGTFIYSDTRGDHWWFRPRIQGGVSYAPVNSGWGGVAALQWNGRGKSKSAEDTKFALGSVGVEFTKGGNPKAFVLPISLNLGAIPHNPFTNLWVSPSYNQDKQVGLTITATF